MGNVRRARVDYKDLPKELRPLAESSQSSRSEKERVFKALMAAFRKQVVVTGVVAECKQREYYESPGEKRRRKRRESERERSKGRNRG